MHYGGLHDDAVNGKAYDLRLLGRFMRYVRPYSLIVLATIVILPLVTLCRLAQPLIVREAIDRAIIPGDGAALWQPALMLVAVLVAEALLTWGEVYALQYLGQRIMYDMRQELFQHVMKLPVRWFDRTPAGGVVTRMTSDVEALGEMFAAGIVSIIGDVLLLLGIMAVMLSLAPDLALVTFSVVPFLAFVAWYFRRSMRTAYRTVRTCLGRMNSALSELVDNLAIVQSFRQERAEEERFRVLNSTYCEAGRPVVFWDAALYAFVEFFSSVAIALIIWYGSGSMDQGVLTFGTLVAFIQYIEKFFSPIRDLSAKYGVMQGAMASLERIFQLLDEPPEESAATDSGDGLQPSKLPPLVMFDAVSFAYDAGPQILHKVSFTVQRGERVAIVGRSGGGKTTILRLLTRLYDGFDGTISVDGRLLTTIPPRELRQRIAVVAQEAELLAGSIRDNISLGDPAADCRVEAAVAAVGADRFIAQLPSGLDTKLGSRATELSHGERQLLAFARALAFDPELLLLDEATASVDSHTEVVIQEGMRRLLQGRTALIVAHRLATIQDADRILVLENGSIVEQGNHQELLARKGVYHRLYTTSIRLGLGTVAQTACGLGKS